MIERHPGLAFGMQSQEYQRSLDELGTAYSGVFPGQSLDRIRGAGKSAREGSLAGIALSDRVAPGEFSSTLETFRQETGRAPTPAEFRERRNRPAQQPGRPGASAQIALPDPPGERGTPRPAVSGPSTPERKQKPN